MSKKKPEPKRIRGRPSGFSKELAQKLCDKIATTDIGTHVLCKRKEFPSITTVYRWLNDHEEFRNMYARAKEAQADLLAHQIVELSNRERVGKTTTTQTGQFSGTTTTKSDNYNRTRLQIDARKWLASKLAPRKYGDKVDITSDHKALSMTVLTVDDVAKKEVEKLK